MPKVKILVNTIIVVMVSWLLWAAVSKEWWVVAFIVIWLTIFIGSLVIVSSMPNRDWLEELQVVKMIIWLIRKRDKRIK